MLVQYHIIASTGMGSGVLRQAQDAPPLFSESQISTLYDITEDGGPEGGDWWDHPGWGGTEDPHFFFPERACVQIGSASLPFGTRDVTIREEGM